MEDLDETEQNKSYQKFLEHLEEAFQCAKKGVLLPKRDSNHEDDAKIFPRFCDYNGIKIAGTAAKGLPHQEASWNYKYQLFLATPDYPDAMFQTHQTLHCVALGVLLQRDLSLQP